MSTVFATVFPHFPSLKPFPQVFQPQSNWDKLWASPNEHQLCTFYTLWIPRKRRGSAPMKTVLKLSYRALQTLMEETWELNETVTCYRFPLSKLLESEIMLNEFISKWIGSFQWTGFVQCINILQWWRQISLWSKQQHWEKIFLKQASDKELVSRT